MRNTRSERSGSVASASATRSARSRSNTAGSLARAGFLLETLAGGTAKCTIAADDPGQTQFVVERNVPAPTRIYRDGVQQTSDSAVLHRIEIFSQGDLQTIADAYLQQWKEEVARCEQIIRDKARAVLGPAAVPPPAREARPAFGGR